MAVYGATWYLIILDLQIIPSTLLNLEGFRSIRNDNDYPTQDRYISVIRKLLLALKDL